ncbi:unnamed protein product [Sphagnum compactum]
MSIGWGYKLICQDFFPPIQLWLHFWFSSDSPKFFGVLSSPSATKIILCEATIGWCTNPHVGWSLHNSNKQLAIVYSKEDCIALA